VYTWGRVEGVARRRFFRIPARTLLHPATKKRGFAAQHRINAHRNSSSYLYLGGIPLWCPPALEKRCPSSADARYEQSAKNDPRPPVASAAADA